MPRSMTRRGFFRSVALGAAAIGAGIVAALGRWNRRDEPAETAEPLLFYVIAEPCVGVKDGSCVEVCPVDAIYAGEDQYYIHPEECIACGACEAECPVGAIFQASEVPGAWTAYIEKNRLHFR